MTCEAQEVTTRGANTNTATVVGTPPGGLPDVLASDSSYYFGIEPGVSAQKLTNGEDVAAAPGVFILTGDRITSYNVCYTKLLRELINTDATNTGNGEVLITYDPATDACPVTPVVLEPPFTG